MNVNLTTTIEAGEDLSSSQYLAICLDDGKVATTGEEAAGILLNKPESGQHATLAYVGEIDYLAGGAITKGAKLTVGAGGYVTAADSSDTVVGEAKETITSGSIGIGMFAFSNATKPSVQMSLAVTCALATAKGTGYALDDNKNANNGEEFAGMTTATLSSGDTGEIVMCGICQGLSDPALATSVGDPITITTSGYIKPGDSGDYIVGRAVENIGSATLGNVFIFPVGGYLSV